jgi:hypothetical protein
MSSERQRQANRNNARLSTGPRTSEGKLRARRNVLRHGLATKPTMSSHVERIARAICRESANQLQHEEARNIAESQLLVQTVRAARMAAVRRALVGSPALKQHVADADELSQEDGQTPSQEGSRLEIDDLIALQRALTEMSRYDRYERRALSRRQRAIRSFDATSILGVRATPRQR